MLADEIRALAERLFMKSAGDDAEEDSIEAELRALAAKLEGKVVVPVWYASYPAASPDRRIFAILECGCSGYEREPTEAFGADKAAALEAMQKLLDGEG